MTDQDKITALRDALKQMRATGKLTDECWQIASEALAMTADASEPSAEPVAWMVQDAADVEMPGTGSRFLMFTDPSGSYRGLTHVTPLYATPPTADSAADARAKEAYDYRHLTQVAQGMGFEDIAGALTELVRLRGDEPVIDSEATFKTVKESFNRGWNAGYRAAQQGAGKKYGWHT